MFGETLVDWSRGVKRSCPGAGEETGQLVEIGVGVVVGVCGGVGLVPAVVKPATGAVIGQFVAARSKTIW